MPKWITKILKRLQPRAVTLTKNSEQRNKLFAKAIDKLPRLRRGSMISEILDDIKWLIHMLHSYFKGTYKEISYDTVLLIITGLIYFVMPIDIVPDMLPGGILDDATILSFIIKSLHNDINYYRTWWKEHQVESEDIENN